MTPPTIIKQKRVSLQKNSNKFKIYNLKLEVGAFEKHYLAMLFE